MDSSETLQHWVIYAVLAAGMTLFGVLAKLVFNSVLKKLEEMVQEVHSIGRSVDGHTTAIAVIQQQLSYLGQQIATVSAETGHARERTDKLAEYWKNEFERYRQLIHERLNAVTRDLLKRQRNDEG